jgi:periplasmic protein TonB
MHAELGQIGNRAEGVATWRARFPEPRPDLLASVRPAPLAGERAVYGAGQRPSWLTIALILGAHALLLFVLVKFDVIATAKPKPRPLVVDLLTLPPPPPVAAAPIEQKLAPPEETVAPKVVAPPPVVDVLAPAAPVVVTRDPSAPKAVVVAPAAPAAPSGPLSVDDLSSKMVSAPPPRYPLESRRRKEQGTVFLSVLVGTDGSVAEIGVSRSSGWARLDKAAIEAVRRWRWSPTTRGGEPVMVRGIVDIPFLLQG